MKRDLAIYLDTETLGETFSNKIFLLIVNLLNKKITGLNSQKILQYGEIKNIFMDKQGITLPKFLNKKTNRT